jgi:hypothetical protein
MKYGLANYFKPTPKNVQKWLLATKTILATIGTAEFFSGNSKIAFYIMLGGAILNELANLFGDDNNEGN